MNKNEILQLKKNEALNKIRKIYHPLTKNNYGHHSEGSYREQESEWVQQIIETLEKELKAVRKEYEKEG